MIPFVPVWAVAAGPFVGPAMLLVGCWIAAEIIDAVWRWVAKRFR